MKLDADSALSIHNLSYKYAKNQPDVLRNISANFPLHKMTAIVGPNGAGKTTLIKHFNGFFLPQNGEIFVNGQALNKKSRKTIQKQIGIVFQNPDEQIFYPKVYDDVAFGPRNMNLSLREIRERVTQAGELAQISHLMDRITFNLSFGEKKKVAIAGILAMRPEILVLDEPTLGIDPWAKSHFITLIRSFCPEKTVIVITHDFEIIKSVDYIILIKEGEVKGKYIDFNSFYKEEFAS
jgi:cobalt/nickel transport system ATP-binding protein